MKASLIKDWYNGTFYEQKEGGGTEEKDQVYLQLSIKSPIGQIQPFGKLWVNGSFFKIVGCKPQTLYPILENLVGFSLIDLKRKYSPW